MNIDCRFAPVFADVSELSGKTAIVIDVLRATTTIVAALQHGARRVIPVATVEDAKQLREKSPAPGSVLLAGERNMKRIPGFDLGNSPLEFSDQVVGDKTIILTTTNGAQALVRARAAETIFVAAFANAHAVARAALDKGMDTEIICSGTELHFSLEDTLCAGYIVHEILAVSPETRLTDGARMALLVYTTYGPDMSVAITRSEHAQALINEGFSADVAWCGMLNQTPIVPVCRNNSITLDKSNFVSSTDVN
jgi:2-phosphosulfolactate phosphatase